MDIVYRNHMKFFVTEINFYCGEFFNGILTLGHSSITYSLRRTKFKLFKQTVSKNKTFVVIEIIVFCKNTRSPLSCRRNWSWSRSPTWHRHTSGAPPIHSPEIICNIKDGLIALHQQMGKIVNFVKKTEFKRVSVVWPRMQKHYFYEKRSQARWMESF